MVAVVSTEELLLNFYRSWHRYGNNFQFLIDTSHCCTTKRNLGCIIVEVASPTQTGQVVACAMTTKEDTEGHEFILGAVKHNVEMVVNARVRADHVHC